MVADAESALMGAAARRDILVQGPRPEAVAEGEAKVVRARAAEAAAAAKVELMVVAAPIDGVVEKVLCHPGEMLSAGAVAAEVLDAAKVLVTADVPAAEAAEVREGQAAWVSVEGGSPAAATVAFVGAATSPATGLVPVTVAGEGLALRPGAVARVEIVVAKVDGALAVPTGAVVPAEEGPSIAVVREEKGKKKAAVLQAKVGLRDPAAGLVQVEAEGLEAGDLVIVSGAYSLPDGQPLKIEEASRDAAKEAPKAGEDPEGHGKEPAGEPARPEGEAKK